MTFVALVSVACVALVRKDALDHAIWTVVVVSHLVVTDHRRRHSLELVSVEAPEIEIGSGSLTRYVSALALPFSPAGGGAGGNPGGPGESGGPGGPGGAGGVSRRTSGSSKKVNLGGDGDMVSSPPSFSGPESSQNTTIVYSRGSVAVLKKKANWATRHTLANWS